MARTSYNWNCIIVSRRKKKNAQYPCRIWLKCHRAEDIYMIKVICICQSNVLTSLSFHNSATFILSVVEDKRTKRSRPTSTHRPSSGLFIRETSNTTNYSVTSSDDDDDVPTQLAMMLPTAGNLTARRLGEHAESSNGITLSHEIVSISFYTFLKPKWYAWWFSRKSFSQSHLLC